MFKMFKKDNSSTKNELLSLYTLAIREASILYRSDYCDSKAEEIERVKYDDEYIDYFRKLLNQL